MGEYSDSQLRAVEYVSEIAFFTKIKNITEVCIWNPKSVVGSEREMKQ